MSSDEIAAGGAGAGRSHPDAGEVSGPARGPEAEARDANGMAQWDPPGPAGRPARVRLAGIVLSLWVEADCTVRVAVKASGAAPWLRREDGTICVQFDHEQEEGHLEALLATGIVPPAAPTQQDARAKVVPFGRKAPPPQLHGDG